MTTATKTKPSGFEAAYAAAHAATSDLRASYAAVDAGERRVALEVAREREAARVAFVAGLEHASTGRLAEAQRELVESDGSEGFTAAVGQLVDAGQSRLDLAVDEVAAARRQLATTVGMIARVDGRPARLVEAAGLSSVAGLRGTNGDPYDWGSVEHALRAMGATARDMLRALTERKAPRQLRVHPSEKLQWWLAAGGSSSDSTSEIDDAYAERGPRRAEAAQDALDGASARTPDQRTWMAD